MIDLFGNDKKITLEKVNIDPINFFCLSGLSCCSTKTKVKVELMTDSGMLQELGNGIRGKCYSFVPNCRGVE